MIIQSGGNALDGSSAITTQYDTMTPVGNSQQQQPFGGSSQSSQGNQSSQDSSLDRDSSYESSLDDSVNPNDDFRVSGARAAASHNQNWYIMRTI